MIDYLVKKSIQVQKYKYFKIVYKSVLLGVTVNYSCVFLVDIQEFNYCRLGITV